MWTFLAAEEPASLIVPDSVQKANLAEAVNKIVNMDFSTLFGSLIRESLWILVKVLIALAIYFIGRWLVRRFLRLIDVAMQHRNVDISLRSFTRNTVSAFFTLLLILIVTQCEGIRNYFMQCYASVLSQEPNLLSGIFNEKYLANYTERHVRWSYNKVFLHFIETIQRVTEAQSHYDCLFHQTLDIKQLASYRSNNDTVFAIDNHAHSIYL